MWKYLTLNALWFSMLFLVHFFGTRRSQRFVLFFIFAVSCLMLFQEWVDPFAWFFYLLFSLTVFWSAAQFKHWVFSSTALLDEELDVYSRRFEKEKQALAFKERAAEKAEMKANEISHLYDKAREMSQSLDPFEAFVILGESLSKNFPFTSIKLALLNEEGAAAEMPSAREVLELERDIFDAWVYDRRATLKERGKARSELLPSEKKVLQSAYASQRPLFAGPGAQMSFSAYPILIDKKMFAALLVLGPDTGGNPLVSLLVAGFVAEMQRLKLYERVETLAITDGLTGVFVRRHLMERLEREVERCARFGLKLSFLMIDVDLFKRFNDDYGHLVGDVVLKQVAQTIRKSIREVDVAGRYGGEEFGVLLIETDEQAAFLVAERIRRSIDEKIYKAYDEQLKASVSIGCATYSKVMNDPTLIVEAADSALYQAKRQGRNRVCLSTLSQENNDGPL